MHLKILLQGNDYRECINETKLFFGDGNAVMLECIMCEHNTQTACALIHTSSSFFSFFPPCVLH